MTAPQPQPTDGPQRVRLRDRIKTVPCPSCKTTGTLRLRRHIEPGGIPMEIKAPSFPAVWCSGCGYTELPRVPAGRP